MNTEHKTSSEQPNIPGWLTVTEAAERLGIQPGTIRRYSSRGTIRGQRLGWTLLFSESEISRFAAAKRTAGRPKSPKSGKLVAS